MSLDAGLLRHRVRLEEYAPVLDSNGQQVPDNASGVEMEWRLVAEVWAAVEPLSVREYMANQAMQSKVSVRVTIRYRADVEAGMRVVYRGKYHDIHGVLNDKDSGLEYLTLPCSEGVNLGQ